MLVLILFASLFITTTRKFPLCSVVCILKVVSFVFGLVESEKLNLQLFKFTRIMGCFLLENVV